MTKIELKAELEANLANAESDFEKNMIKAEYEHKLKLLGLQDEIDLRKLNEDNSDYTCVGCGS